MGESRSFSVDTRRSMTLYQSYIYHIFRQKIESGEFDANDEIIPFDRDDINKALSENDLPKIGNEPDLVYNLRSRKELPQYLREKGYKSVVHDVSQEKGSASYAITKRKQRLDVISQKFNKQADLRHIPDHILEFVAFNEQGLLGVIRRLNIINDLVGVEKCDELEQHVQIGSSYGQSEIDALYVVEENGEYSSVILEGKAGNESFTRNQLRMNVLAVVESERYPDPKYVFGYKPIPGDASVLAFAEFDVPLFPKDGVVEIVDQKGYVLSNEVTQQTLHEIVSGHDECEESNHIDTEEQERDVMWREPDTSQLSLDEVEEHTEHVKEKQNKRAFMDSNKSGQTAITDVRVVVDD